MWPLDRASARECVRVGRLAVERWTCTAQSMSLVASQLLPADAGQKPACIAGAVKALYPSKPSGKVSLIVESAWLPLLLADTGGALWSKTQVEALLRHRLEMLYSDSAEPVSSWDLRVEHRAGQRLALGFGLPHRVKQSLMEAGDSIDLRWDALVPSFAWGWQRLRPSRAWPRRCGWWLWPEQDRLLAARFVRDEMVGLNAGLPQIADVAEIERLVAIEGVRQGAAANSVPISLATWDRPARLARDSKRIVPVSIIGPLRAEVTAAGTLQQAAKVSI